MPLYAEIALLMPVRKVFTYRVPEVFENRIERGLLVHVPVMKKTVSGVVLRCSTQTDLEEGKIKNILDVPFPETKLPENVLRLSEWAAEYYIAPVGEVLKAALPAGLGTSSRLIVVLTEEGRSRDPALPPEHQAVFAEVRAASATIPVSSLKKKFPAARLSKSLDFLEANGYLRLEEKIRPSFLRPRVQKIFFASENAGERLVERCGRSAKKSLLVRCLLENANGLSLEEARKIYAGSTGFLEELLHEGLVRSVEKEVFRDTITAADSPESFSLNPEQKEALLAIENALDTGKFSPFLIFGVTGSGKTAIYTEAIARVLSAGLGALYLVPEIALTPLLARKLKGLFGERVSLLHSGLRGGERYDEWRRIRSGRTKLVLGTRSAVFAPISPLKLIIVDEEHDPSYKQDESPRYNARDLAVLRAKLEEAVVVLGSATPSMESYDRALNGKYGLLSLTSRVEERTFADVEVVDMAREFRERSRIVILSDAVEKAITDRIEKKEQMILLLNRRGYACFLLCRQCGAVAECPHCSLSLTYHAAEKRLKCHTCGFRKLPPPACPKCGGDFLEFVGYGTEKVEQFLRERFPGLTLHRLDRDTVRTREDFERILMEFREGKIQMILGTQMVAKGHDFPGVTLVGVISVDAGLGIPDFRMPERTFQILTQVSGRAGRGPAGGVVIYQTFHPENYAIRFARAQNFPAFYEHELRYRKIMKYPPFTNMIHFILKANSEKQAEADAERLAGFLKEKAAGFQVLGPAPAPYPKLKGKYRYQIILKGKSRTLMRKAVLQAFESLKGKIDAKRIEVDVDPVHML
jgi:primosomal protein N' (replication factor Y)